MPVKKPADPIEQKVRLINSIVDRYERGEHWKWCQGMMKKHLPDMAEMIKTSDDPKKYINMLSPEFYKLSRTVTTFMAAIIQYGERLEGLDLDNI